MHQMYYKKQILFPPNLNLAGLHFKFDLFYLCPENFAYFVFSFRQRRGTAYVQL